MHRIRIKFMVSYYHAHAVSLVFEFLHSYFSHILIKADSFDYNWTRLCLQNKQFCGSCGLYSSLRLILCFLISQIADFWKEALILSSLHHPNVVSFYGIVRDGPDGSLATVTEFMVNGSLKQFLQKKDRLLPFLSLF